MRNDLTFRLLPATASIPRTNKITARYTDRTDRQALRLAYRALRRNGVRPQNARDIVYTVARLGNHADAVRSDGRTYHYGCIEVTA